MLHAWLTRIGDPNACGTECDVCIVIYSIWTAYRYHVNSGLVLTVSMYFVIFSARQHTAYA